MDTKYQAFAALLFYLAISTINAQAPPQCNATALDECVNRYYSVSTLFQNFTIDSNTIDSSCRTYNEAVGCVKNFTQCPDTDRNMIIKWLGVRQTHGLFCAEGKTDYIMYQRCLGNGTFTNLKRANCSVVDNYVQPLQYNLTADNTCKQYTEALDCQQWAAEAACGKETGNYVRKIAAMYMDPQVKAIAPTCTGRCNPAALDACLKDFNPYSGKFLGASLNATDLVEACRLHPVAAQCIKEKTTCTEEDTLVQSRWGGNKALAEYTCGEGRNAYLRNRDCLSNSSYIASRENCSTVNPVGNPVANPTLVQQACQAVINQVVCVNNVAEVKCGKDAAGYVSTIIPRFLAPTIKAISPNCNLPGLNAAPLLYTSLTLILSCLFAALF